MRFQVGSANRDGQAVQIHLFRSLKFMGEEIPLYSVSKALAGNIAVVSDTGHHASATSKSPSDVSETAKSDVPSIDKLTFF